VLTGPLLFVAASLLVVVTAASIVARVQLTARLDQAVAFGVVAVTQIELSLLIAGAAFDSLERLTLVGVNAAMTAAALLYGHRQLLESFRKMRRPRLGRLSPWVTALVGLALAELVWRVFSAAVLPPYAWDGLSYHLTTTAEWIQRGEIVTNPLSLCCAHYPLNTELTFVWPGLLLGNDSLVDGVQIGFAVLGALAVAGVGRVSGLTGRGAAAVGAIFFLTPVVLAQSATNYNDVAFTGMFLCGLFFALRYVISGIRRPAYLGLAGFAAGFALGSKGTGLAYVGVLGLVVLAGVVMLRVRGDLQTRAVLATLGVFVAGLIATGGFWYGRNLLQHGNPVYPFDLSVGGVQIFSGRFHLNEVLSNPSQYRGESNWHRVLHSWFHDARPSRGGDGFYEYEERVGGFGIVWPWLMLPALAGFVVFSARRRRDLLLALIVPVLLIFLLQPYEWWSRFTMILPALGAVALVHLVERLRGRLRTVLQAATVALVFFGAALATGKVDPAGHGREISAFRVVRLAAEPYRERTLGSLFHSEYAWLDAVPQDARIDVELGDEPRFISPAFGPKFERPIHALLARDERGFKSQLTSDRADYVFVGHGSKLDRLAVRDPALTLVYRNYRVSAYRVGETG
jgi:hypothetical protein